MSTIVSTQAMNIVEAHKRENYTDTLSFLGELVKRNDILKVAPWYPSSDGIFHKWLQATRLGRGTFVQVNGPVATTSSGSDLKVEPIASYQADSLVDDKILKTSKTPGKVRDSEDAANMEGAVSDWLYQFMYGVNTVEGFRALAERRASIDSEYVWDDGGTGTDVSSLWLFEFGEQGFNFRYPQGSQPGISAEDMGLQYVTAPGGGGNMWAWMRHIEVYGGMEIKKEKAMLRLANIETGGSTIKHAKWIAMKNQLPNLGRDAVGFANRTIHAIIETAAYDKSNAAYSIETIEGFGPIVKFVGIPVMFWETILDTETALT